MHPTLVSIPEYSPLSSGNREPCPTPAIAPLLWNPEFRGIHSRKSKKVLHLQQFTQPLHNNKTKPFSKFNNTSHFKGPTRNGKQLQSAAQKQKSKVGGTFAEDFYWMRRVHRDFWPVSPAPNSSCALL
ncbi:hypothetical protein JTE90_005621 [Oedothorax gibbosus]|uniref:Uncharacterized protein n=1 Tax=Oedothorax gibbosus TaxID=931172 RepID=A0AAV6UIQ1_9ARAC|nr:hypothetical protein JTE90_005621 [Oedothorax gibbosus]